MMNDISFAMSVRQQFADSYKRDGPQEILQGSGVMNTSFQPKKSA